ncbi:arylsulfatase [Streptomyces sp. WAC 01529]|uniref:aspartate/glutamate racemase family protein n=1 Tax=Streptomyces sp. WAC 01529 TaxID=2203205 RepID=UPI000F6F1815|nr:aspartate/glutamate racemase family protein [Streptomyces sp. WAC 01529]AZM56961.1 arylsulfatase [Streptomyces sp. WAC 01529]
MVTLGLLHTSSAHVPVFDGLRDAHHPGVELRHHVVESLLERARSEGPEAVAPDVRTALLRAAGAGAAAVLCTCSSIGGVAEAMGPEVGVPVLRVDRPMAAAAVAAGPRIVVLATVESTLGPTVALVEDEARKAGREAEVRSVVVDGAWERFAAGDTEGCAALVARAVSEVRDADAVVLAQASMAAAEDLVPSGSARVFSSPRVGLDAAVAAARGAGGGALGGGAPVAGGVSGVL